MNKFGLLDEEEAEATEAASFSERLASFPPAAPKHRIDIAAMDAAAAPHGFVSREVSTAPPLSQLQQGRRRRLLSSEPTRHLAIRLTTTQYERFVAYADKHKLTYHDALARLLDSAGD